MLAAEAAYCALEDDLQHYLDTYARTHDYDEYHFDLDAIEHDPYVLISMISALHEGAWTLDEVLGTLQDLFDRQYILTEDVVVEVRYRTVTDTRTDSEGNDYEDTWRCRTTITSAMSRWKTSTSPTYPVYHDVRGAAFHVRPVYVHVGEPPRSVSRSSGYIGKVHHQPPAGA